MIGNFVNCIKSKSLTDVVYIVMMILIVTLIKDMVRSMIRKRKDKKWLENAFKTKRKNKKDDVMEGFNSVCPTEAPGDDVSFCDKMKFLLCNDNFGKMKALLEKISIENGKFDFVDIHAVKSLYMYVSYLHGNETGNSHKNIFVDASLNIINYIDNTDNPYPNRLRVDSIMPYERDQGVLFMRKKPGVDAYVNNGDIIAQILMNEGHTRGQFGSYIPGGGMGKFVSLIDNGNHAN